MAFWNWVKKYWGAVLGAMAAILGILFAIDHERKKVSRLKASVKLQKIKNEMAESRVQSADRAAREDALKDRDEEVQLAVESIETQIEEKRENASNKTATQVADRLNDLYD